MAKEKDKSSKELIRLHEIIEKQITHIISLKAEIANLRHQATGYDSVVDFLWHKLQER